MEKNQIVKKVLESNIGGGYEALRKNPAHLAPFSLIMNVFVFTSDYPRTQNAIEKNPEITACNWPFNGLWCKDKPNLIPYWIWNGLIVKMQNHKAFGWKDGIVFPKKYFDTWRKEYGVNYCNHKRGAIDLWERYCNRFIVTKLQRKGKSLGLFDGYWDTIYNGKFHGPQKMSA